MTAETNVDDIISGAQTFADQTRQEADSALSSALGGALSIQVPPLADFDPITVEPPDTPAVPTFQTPNTNIGAPPPAPGTQTIYPFYGRISNPPTDIDYSFDAGDPPTPFTEQAPARPDVDTDYISPETPNIAELTAPFLSDLDIPEAPDVTVPDAGNIHITPPSGLPDADITCDVGVAPGESMFELEVLVDSDAPVTNVFDKAYNAALPVMRQNVDRQVEAFIERFAPGSSERLQALEEYLDGQLDGTNVGFDEEQEQALYDRARGRSRKAARDATNQSFHEVALRGFTLPTGVLLAGLDKGQQEEASKNAETAMDIVVKQADLMQKNTHFALQMAAELRTSVRNAGLQYAQTLVNVNGQAADYAKEMSNILVSAYKAERDYYQQFLNYMQTLSAQYELELKASLAQIDIYTAEMQGIKVESDVQRNQVAIYSEQINAEKLKISFYAEQLNAIAQEIKNRSLVLDIYRTDVQAYATKADAKKSEAAVYEAVVRGQEGELRAELAKLDGYKAEVDAYGARVNAYAAEVNAKVGANRSIVEAYKGEIQAYVAQADVTKITAQTELSAYQAGLEAYKAQVEESLTTTKIQAEADITNMKLQAESNIAEFEANIKTNESFIRHVDARDSIAVAAGRSYASMAAAAMSGLNAIANIAHETISTEG